MAHNNFPLVSVIIPTYNRPDVLPRAIKSVLAQTYRNIEIIVVDDASRNETEKVVATIQDSRIRYVRHPENRGVAAARNTGLRMAQGDYITFLDHDDEDLPSKLEKQVKLLSESPQDVSYVRCGLLRIYIEGSQKSVPTFAPFPWAAQVHQLLVRKECFKTVGFFDERLQTSDDLDMVFRLSRKYRYVVIETPLAIWHDTVGSLSKNSELWLCDIHLLLDKHKKMFSGKKRGFWLQAMGRQYMKQKDALTAYKMYVQSFKANPAPDIALKLIRYTPLAMFTAFKSKRHTPK